MLSTDITYTSLRCVRSAPLYGGGGTPLPRRGVAPAGGALWGGWRRRLLLGLWMAWLPASWWVAETEVGRGRFRVFDVLLETARELEAVRLLLDRNEPVKAFAVGVRDVHVTGEVHGRCRCRPVRLAARSSFVPRARSGKAVRPSVR